MKSIKSHLFGALFLVLATACSSGGDDPAPTDNDPITIPDPAAATLVFPANDTECNEGAIVNDQQSTVTFRWNASENTDSYEVRLRNLDSNTSSTTQSNTNEADITILRGTPYEWHVVSKANNTSVTATSEAWRFYNEGPGVENYAPFPAEAIAPSRGANLVASTTSVTLQWEASDVDDDIVEFEVFLDTNEDPTTSLGTITESTVSGVAVTSGNTYYWKVITKDGANNTSTSEVFGFKIL